MTATMTPAAASVPADLRSDHEPSVLGSPALGLNSERWVLSEKNSPAA